MNHSNNNNLLKNSYFKLSSDKVFLAVIIVLYLGCVSCRIADVEGSLFTSSFSNEVELGNMSDSAAYDSKIKNFMMKGAAKALGLDLRQIVDKELGIPIVQDIFNSIKMQHANKNVEEEKHLIKLSKRIEKKIAVVLKFLNETVDMIEDFGNRGESKIHFDCSGLFTNDASSDCEVFRNSSLSNVTVICSSLNISELFQVHHENVPTIKNEYFLPAGDDYRTCASDSLYRVCLSSYSDYCQPLNDPYFEHVYLKSIDHNPRQIVLIIDHGHSLSQNQLSVAKSLSKYIVTSLGHGDQVCIIGLSETAVSLCDDGHSCENNKHHLLNFIDSLSKSKGSTNHSLGFELAFDLINNVLRNASSDFYTNVVYISKGLLSSIAEAKSVLEVIAVAQRNLSPGVIINTCALVDEWKPVLYEKHFLRDIAQQNFFKYNISFDEPLVAGVMEELSVSSNSELHAALGPTARRLLGSLHIDDHINNRVNFFLPQLDEIRTDPVVTISRIVQVKSSGIIGVVAMQVFLEDILEDVIYFNVENSYAFVINTEGYILMHPSLKQVGYFLEQPWIIDVSLLESIENISAVRTSILRKDVGELIAKRKSDGKLVEYSWQKLDYAPYIVVIVSEVNSKPKLRFVPSQFEHVSSQFDTCTNNCDLVYNRLDYLIAGQYSLCRHINDITTLDAGSLFLSASCFQSPFKYLLSDKNSSYFNIPNYMAYIKDKTKLLANPGLKSGIRSEIISLSSILAHWKKQFFNSRLNKYIIRRYIATKTGIMIMYPGTQVHHRFDPARCVWFTSAVNNPSRLMLTAPYPDTGEAGYIVTISQAFLSSSTGTEIVVAMDVNIGYLFVLLMDVLPYCSPDGGGNNVKCFIMDDRGYLLSHPTLSAPGLRDSNGKLPVEGQHITYKESLVANDILNHKGLVEKLVCSDLPSGTVQRYYQFNTSVSKVISNFISGDQCVQYQLVTVPTTNIFMGVVNTTCDNSAFCPCSRIDRHCLNCDRMEQTACECPCECPLNLDCSSSKQIGPLISPCSTNCDTDVCHCSITSAVPFHLHQSVHHPLLSKVKSCTVRECHQYVTYRSCVGVIGCEWCNYKSDGVTQLVNPFCTIQPLCFNGVLGSNMPFGEGTIHGSTVKDGSGLHSKSSSTGAIPMGGAVVAFLFAFALMCHCYHKRSQTSQVTRHDHNCMRPVSLFALEKNNNNRIIEEPPTEPHNGLLQSAQEVSVALLTPVSPYLMNTGYCRPPTGDSDHGYSTMTPHEEVELEPPVPVQQTLLSHHILAPVTVHMVMDT